MVDTQQDNTAPFQKNTSDFISISKFLLKELASNVTQLEDHMYMVPLSDTERRSNREPFREFRMAFSDLFLITKNVVKDKELVRAITMWLDKTRFKAESKNEDFTTGIGFAKMYIDQMYAAGILDLHVSEPVEYPFEDVMREVVEENERMKREQLSALQMDISRDYVPKPNEPIDIEKLAGIKFVQEDLSHLMDVKTEIEDDVDDIN